MKLPQISSADLVKIEETLHWLANSSITTAVLLRHVILRQDKRGRNSVDGACPFAEKLSDRLESYPTFVNRWYKKNCCRCCKMQINALLQGKQSQVHRPYHCPTPSRYVLDIQKDWFIPSSRVIHIDWFVIQ